MSEYLDDLELDHTANRHGGEPEECHSHLFPEPDRPKMIGFAVVGYSGSRIIQIQRPHTMLGRAWNKFYIFGTPTTDEHHMTMRYINDAVQINAATITRLP